ncbi:MAG: PKD domain-containing protein, partial [Deltaproteobacteria bacterium]|nr:PKD domain-containing protein [Deltaproteobacteria bacterium]
MRFASSPVACVLTLVGAALLASGCEGCEDDAEGGGGAGTGATGGGGSDDPCAGVVCNAPPPFCVEEATLRTVAGEGACVDGSCVFDDFTDEPCTDCCYGAEINLTGDPLGGGVGYSEILAPGDAAAVVSDAAGLLTALENAGSGDVIYVDDGAEIDLTDQESIDIAAGVTLASGRGRDGSLGGLVYCDSYAYPLFRAQGEAVRLTGLRLRGPNPDIGDHDYDLVVHSGLIRTSHPAFEADNNEIWAWGTSAISLSGGALDAHVHHNFIHHTRRAGLGYGVVLNQAEALIEGNIFDTCRHHIAATGRPGTSYEAAYNLVLEHAHSHYFDMHGARDYDKNETKAIWRFDEGEGDTAEDSSIGYYHPLNHCTLTHMDTASCWVPGQINTALAFDGVDDHLECGSDGSLTSEQGTIELFLQPAALGQAADLVHLVEDSPANYLTLALTPTGQISLRIEDDNVEHVALTSDGSITAGGFHHVAVTQDGTEVVMYIDGQPTGVTGTNGTYWSNHLALTDSWVGAGPGGYFGGLLDEVRIYSRALIAEEITLHYEGNSDIAGNEIRIHHNTFRGTDQAAVVIRGKPAVGAWVHHNWFHNPDPDRAVRQVNAQGNIDVQDNHFGGETPLGTLLPEASATVTPSHGTAPLEVVYDGSASSYPLGAVATHHWQFGDGQSAYGETTSHDLPDPGRYLARLTVSPDSGAWMSQLVPVVAAPSDGGYWLDLWVKDSYPGPLTDFYRKQVLVDGQLVWEDDVAGNEGWEHVAVEVTDLVSGQERVDLTLRAQNITAVSNEELIELDVFWDDVILFGAEVAGGDFESSAAWTYEEGADSWSGRYASAEPHSGDASYRMHHPYKADCPAGSYAQITQSVPVKSPDLRASWRLDDGVGATVADGSLYANHGTLTDMDLDACWVPGMMSRALSFDGIDDHVVAEPATSLAAAEGSILLWLAQGAMGTEQTLLELFDDGRHDWLSVRITAEGRLRVVITDDDTVVVDAESDAVIDDTELHHVAVTQDGSAIQLYLDGAPTTTSGANGSHWSDHIAPAAVWLGGGQTSHFAGVLDEIEVYAYALDGATVAAAHEKGSPLAHYRFDEGQGSTAADSTGNGHDGTLTDMEPGSCWVSGPVDGALEFDGLDDYVEVTSVGNLATAEGTIELWLRPAVEDETLDILNLFED